MSKLIQIKIIIKIKLNEMPLIGESEIEMKIDLNCVTTNMVKYTTKIFFY